MKTSLRLPVLFVAGMSLVLLLAAASVPWTMNAASVDRTDRMRTAANRQQATVASTNALPTAAKRKRVAMGATAITAPALPQEPTIEEVLERARMHTRHRRLAEHVLDGIPPHCAENLRNFYVLYEGAQHRGLGGKTTIILNGTVPDGEFLALLTHECGHVTHAALRGTRAAGESLFADGPDAFFADSPAVAFFALSWQTERVMRAHARKQDFISGYAQTNAFEDFAETFAAYILHPSFLEQRAATNKVLAEKLLWMQTYLPLQENAIAESKYTKKNVIPWDITKLPLMLHATTAGNGGQEQ